MKRFALILILSWSSILMITELKGNTPNSVWENYFPLAVFGAPLLTFMVNEFVNKNYKNKQAAFFVKLNRFVLYSYIAGIVLIPVIIGMFIMNMVIYAAVAVNVLLFILNINIFKPNQS